MNRTKLPLRFAVGLLTWLLHAESAMAIQGIPIGPLKEKSEAELKEYLRERDAYEASGKRVKAGDPEAIRQELDRIWKNEKGTWLDNVTIPASLLDPVIPLIRNGGQEAPPLEAGECVVYGSPQERGFYIFRDAIRSEVAFPAETKIWIGGLRMGDTKDESIAQILGWWEHNKESVMAGRYEEARWLHRSYALDLDAHRARRPEKEKMMEIAIARRDGLPYAHLEAELKELEKTRDQRTKQLTELRLQQEKQTSRQIEELKERENRRRKHFLPSSGKENKSASTSNIIRWSPLAVIPILGGIYLVLRKRFLISR